MRFEVLGPVRIRTRRREIAIAANRQRALLAMLLLQANRTVPAERLVDALWAEDPPRDARSQLHGCVYRLRKQLAAGGASGRVIVTEPNGYRAHVDVKSVDLLEFRAQVTEARSAAKEGRHGAARDAYRAGLALWRGPALAGIDSDEVRQAAAAVDEERAQALEDCLDLELSLGGAGELVGELTELVHQYPYREGLHAALMLALYRADRPAEALAAYQRVRAALVTELGQEPGPALRELHQHILTEDARLRPTRTRRAGEADVPPPPAGQSLPRTLHDFTGRGADLAWLLDAAEQADSYAPVVLSVDGMPGVGKTSLAIRAAHLLKGGYPDGQLFIDLHGHSEQRPVEPAVALDTLLRQLGVPATDIPVELDDRVARWRAELATRRVLLVLDNAAGCAQVTPLLPAGAGCLTLVTSRRRLVDLDGARPWSVDTLDPEDAVALLARVAGARVREEPDAAAEVAKRCGCLPLALRLAAARLAHRPRWRVRDLADRLADPHTPLAELTSDDRTVASAFALSYDHLSPASQRMFRLLGLHPGEHFDAYAAAALADISLDDAKQLLDGLVDAHLVDEPRIGRYRLHDLLKAYSTELAEATYARNVRVKAVERLLDYYLHGTAVAGERLETSGSRRNFRPGEPRRPDLLDAPRVSGTTWLEVERPNLTSAVHYAQAHGHNYFGWQIARAMWRFLYLRGYLDDLVDTHSRGLSAAEHAGDMDAVAMMRNYLASAHFRMGNHDLAAEHVWHAVAHRQRAGDKLGEAIARRNLATVYAEGGRLGEAAQECERALAAARATGDATILAHAVANTGGICLTLGQYSNALTYSRRGLALAREARDAHCIANALGNLGTARARLGQLRPALRLLLAALKARRRDDDRYAEAETLNELGAVYRALGDIDQAVAHHRHALTIVREAGFRQGECAVYNEFGRTLGVTGDTAAALELHQRALAVATKIQNKYGHARALDGIAACLRETDPESARRHWLRALELYRELDVPERHDVERHLARDECSTLS